MNPNVKLTLRKEIRDFLRDKRTLFTMAFLPLVLYPLLLIVFVVVISDPEEIPYRLAVVYEFDRDKAPDTFVIERLEALLLPTSENDTVQNGGEISTDNETDQPPPPSAPPLFAKVYWNVGPEAAKRLLERGRIDAVLVLPQGFATEPWYGPERRPRVYHRPTDEESIEARRRLVTVLASVRRELIERRVETLDDAVLTHLLETEVIEEPSMGFTSAESRSIRSAKELSRMLIFLVLTMALTGAFYPAIDTVAGEKERGTLETLLTSPASRFEIVIGKYLAVFTISVATALINVIAMAGTLLIVSRLQAQAMPGAADPGRLLAMALRLAPIVLVILVPVAALFGALALAASAHARSSREAQYYFAPLFLVVMPLSLVALVPTIELTPIKALIPVGGASLLFRELFAKAVDPAYPEPWPWLSAVVVFASTALYALLVLRWTRGLFEDEEVLFRESGQRTLRAMVLKKYNVTTGLPTAGQAVFLVLAALAGQFFIGDLALARPVIGHLVTMFVLFVGLTLVACRASKLDTVKTLRLRPPRAVDLLLGLGLLIALLSPLTELGGLLTHEGMGPEVERYRRQIEAMFFQGIDPWISLVLIAAVPGLCEEVLFRGYVLSGFLSKRRAAWLAIVLTGAIFAAVHLQWYGFGVRFVLGAALAGVTLASRSLWPAVAMHALFNARAVLTLTADRSPTHPLGRAGQWLMETAPVWFEPQTMDAAWVRWTTLAVSLAATVAIGYALAIRGREDG